MLKEKKKIKPQIKNRKIYFKKIKKSYPNNNDEITKRFGLKNGWRWLRWIDDNGEDKRNLKVQRKKKDAATLFMWDLKNEKWKP